MKPYTTLASLAAASMASQAAPLVTTSFETSDGFSNTGPSTAVNITATNDNAVWTTGVGNTNYNGVWSGDPKTGSLSAVIGNAGHFLMVDPEGANGVSSVTFSWDEYTNSSGTINVDWSTDGTNWTTAGTVALGNAGANGYGETTINVNQTGDVKIRWIVDASATGGASIDDITLEDQPIALPAGAQLGRVFADHMVLQRNEPVKVFGTDSENLGSQAISVSFDGQVKNTTTDAEGNWEVTLDAMNANATGQTLTVTGSSVTTITDVLIGEVWLAAGQSNMNWRINQSSNTPHASTYPLIRMCNWEGTVGTGPSDVYGSTELAQLTPENFYSGTWQVMDATTVQTQSAVAYFFAHNLAQDLNVPIGIVETAFGGTSTEAFISPAAHASSPHLTEAFERPYACTNLGQWTGVRLFKNVYNNNVANYTHADPSKPHPHPYAPGFLYYTGIEFLKDFTFKGAIWYQGESNAEFTSGKYQINGNRLVDYQTEVMKTLINDWRSAFGKPNFPFHMVQLPRINGSSRAMWPYYREAQARVAKDLDGVELATVMEFGDSGAEVHPGNKEPVGERLAAIARAKQYGDAITYSGPVYAGHTISGNKIILSFEHVGGGLVDTDGGALEGFEISGSDRNFVAATATIVGNTVEVTAASVLKPVAVRHAWDMNADVDLYNGDGFSSSSFRTDKWLAAPGRKLRVACIGDSITFGVYVDTADNYPSQLQDLLGTANFEVQNFGNPGYGIYRTDKRYDNTSEYTNALAWQPDVVICNLGINDLPSFGSYTQEQFETEYFELVDAFAQSGNKPIFLQWNKLAPLYPAHAFYGSADIPTLNTWIKEAAANTNVMMFDMEAPLSNRDEWFVSDDIHPNELGYVEIAETTLCLLDELGDLDSKLQIAEVLAENTSGLQDEDAAYSDWVELVNTGTAGVCLSNKYLTNDLGDYTKWQLPTSTVIGPGQSLVVFASAKDRALNGEQLHTNFTIPNHGAEIGLVDSDGTTLLDSLTALPTQHADISYGRSSVSSAPALGQGSPVKYFIPTDGSLGATWLTTSFDDSTWTNGTTGVGFDTAPLSFTGAQIWDATYQNAWSELNSSATVKTLNGSVLHFDHSGEVAASTLVGTAAEFAPGAPTWDDINSGDWTFEINLKVNDSPNGFAIWLGTDTNRIVVELNNGTTTNNAGTFTATHTNNDNAFHTYKVQHYSATNTYDVWRDGVLLTTSGAVGYDLAGADSRLLLGDYTGGTFGNGFDVEIASVSYSGTLYDGLVQTDLASAMQGTQSSAYLRMPFTVTADPATFNALSLDVQYDDGFVAYLNGTEIARRNAPVSPAWDSAADSDRADTEALSIESIDISSHIGLLSQGSNVLAIHGLNSSAAAERFLVSATLTPSSPEQVLFFETPTPNATNGGIESGSAPYATWKSVYGVSSDSSDNDGDGQSALMEFMMGTSPTDHSSVAGTAVGIATAGEDDYLSVTFNVANNLQGLSYVIEYSDDLISAPIWEVDASASMLSSVDNGDGSSTVSYRLSTAVGDAGKLFARVYFLYNE